MKYQLSVLQRGASASSDVRQIGEYKNLEEAVAAAQQQVNALLAELYTAGMTAEALLEGYRAAGRTLYLFRDDEETMNAASFNHFSIRQITQCRDLRCRQLDFQQFSCRQCRRPQGVRIRRRCPRPPSAASPGRREDSDGVWSGYTRDRNAVRAVPGRAARPHRRSIAASMH